MTTSRTLPALIAIATVSCAMAPESADDEASRDRESAVGVRVADPADRPGGLGACDRHLAELFGAPGSLAAGSGFEPTGFQASHAFSNAADRSQAGGSLPNQWGHLFGYAMHLYGSTPGQTTTTLYVPDGFTKKTAPSGNDSVALFYYPTLAGEHDVTLAVYHVADYAVRKGERNAAGSVRIGRLAGPGGDTPDYLHSHLEVHRGWGLPSLPKRNQTRLFFHDVFCPVGEVAKPVVPPAWTCDAAYYAEIDAGRDDAWCDCACGAPDPDCDRGAQVDGCYEGEACSSAGLCVAP